MSRVQIFFDECPSLTHQSFKDECDIRNIMFKYKRTGLVEHMTSAKAQYGDFTDVPDYHEAMNIVVNAQAVFDSLPADMRKRFGNDPAQYLDFVHNSDNYDEMVKLGMIEVVAQQPDSIKTSPEGESTQ